MLEQKIRKLNKTDNVECSWDDLGLRVVVGYAAVVVCLRYISEKIEATLIYLICGCCNYMVGSGWFSNHSIHTCNHLNIITAVETYSGMYNK
jgi:hypothetical protein